MRRFVRVFWALLGVSLLSLNPAAVNASTLDTIGVTLLRTVDAALAGSGVNVAQAEAPLSTATPPPFEVNPATVGQPVNLFTYYSTLGSATTFPNAVGAESSHADAVGGNFYGTSPGVAPQVAHVDNYEAGYFFNNVIGATPAPAIMGSVVNQSFIFVGLSSSDQAQVEQAYDTYAANHGTIFVSGAGNGGPVSPPATCFNGLGVGAYGGSSSTGPTTDGRSKPDITAPSSVTSFSTPYVSGGAAVLLQAANRGDGGTGTATVAADLRTLKSLLLNGAIKPADWTNGVTTPLDARYGAGILNIYNSWSQLAGGEHHYIESTSNTPGTPHPPGTNPGNEPVLRGWDFNLIANSAPSLREQVNHYYFNLDPNAGGSFTFTATLVWNRQAGQTNINDLNLFLYQVSSGQLVACSTSRVDNVEHIFLPSLPPGRYDLQVEKNPANLISFSETYALAFEMFNLKLSIIRSANNVVLSWPITPAGFSLQSNANLSQPTGWTPVTAPVSISNGQNIVTLPASAAMQFFRLSR